MRLFRPDLVATFVDRPNRFLITARSPDGRLLHAHSPNPGRMWELLYPGTPLILQHAPTGNTSPSKRKTAWSVVAAIRPSDGTVVPLVSTAANDIAAELIIPDLFPRATATRREVTLGESRFDFVVGTGDIETVIEVKSCTLEAYGVAMFPDAATSRGLKHLTALKEMRHRERMVLFVIQGPRAERFVPDIHTDPAFSMELREAHHAGVHVHVVATGTDGDGTTRVVSDNVPVDWEPLTAVDEDSGVYIVHMELPRHREAAIGALGTFSLRPGHYLYVGSAMKSMRSRTARHLRARKRKRWHIDYLRAVAGSAAVYPIYTTRSLECSLARSCAAFCTQPVAGFGSSDCTCGSHLFYLEDDPRRNPAFVEMMLRYRHSEALVTSRHRIH